MKISIKTKLFELELSGGFAFSAAIIVGGLAIVAIEIILLKVLQ